MRCYRRLLNISYKDHVTNKEVRRKIQAAIGEYDELLTLVKKRKLRWFGHVSRSSGLAKTILQGTVKGKRKRGRQKKRWEDNIKEWTLYLTNFCNGLDFPKPVFLSSPYFCTLIRYGTLPETGQKLKLRWYGHILQPSAGLTKRVPQGTLTLLHSERPKLLAFFGLYECNRVRVYQYISMIFLPVFLRDTTSVTSCVLVCMMLFQNGVNS